MPNRFCRALAMSLAIALLSAAPAALAAPAAGGYEAFEAAVQKGITPALMGPIEGLSNAAVDRLLARMDGQITPSTLAELSLPVEAGSQDALWVAKATLRLPNYGMPKRASDALSHALNSELLGDGRDPELNIGAVNQAFAALKPSACQRDGDQALVTFPLAAGTSITMVATRQADGAWRLVRLTEATVDGLDVRHGLSARLLQQWATGIKTEAASAMEKAKVACLQANCRTVQMALEEYATDQNGNYPPAASWLKALSHDNYLPHNQLPKSPWSDGQQTNALALPASTTLKGAKSPKFSPVGTVLGPGKMPGTGAFDLLTYGAIAYDYDPKNMNYVLYGIGQEGDKAVVKFVVSNRGE
jgi:hypothetical protein